MTSRISINSTHCVVCVVSTISNLHHQDSTPFGRYMPTPQPLWSTSPDLLCNSNQCQPFLEICKVLLNSAWAFTGAPESTCSYEAAFRMLSFWLIWESYSGPAEISAQVCGRLWEQPKSLCSTMGGFKHGAVYLTAVVVGVPEPQGIVCIRFIFVTVTRFAISWYGKCYLSKFLYINT